MDKEDEKRRLTEDKLRYIMNKGSRDCGIWLKCDNSQWQWIMKEAPKISESPLFFIDIGAEFIKTDFMKNILNIIDPSMPLDNLMWKDLIHIFDINPSIKNNNIKREDNKILFIIFKNISEFDFPADIIDNFAVIRYIYTICYINKLGLNWIVIDRFNIDEWINNQCAHRSPLVNCFRHCLF